MHPLLCARQIVREQQRQLLLKHQRSRKEPTQSDPILIDPLGKLRNILFFRLLHRFKVAKLEFRHAAAAFLLGCGHRDAVVLKDGNQILTQPRPVSVHIACRKSATFRESSCPGLLRHSVVPVSVTACAAFLIHMGEPPHRRGYRPPSPGLSGSA